MYGRIGIEQFTGLNSTIAPELVKDGEARDILNFRMEKVGKLVSRDGYRVGLEIARWSDAQAIDPAAYHDVVKPYMINGGIVGMGEYVLDDKWDAIDAQRLMVYFIRGEEDPTDYYRNFMTMLVSPLEGAYKNQLLTGRLGTVSAGTDYNSSFDQMPQGKYENLFNMHAPNKWLYPAASSSDDDIWIDHYMKISQYRNRLVISDRINGDMILEDEYNRAAYEQGEKNAHGLHLRPNTLQIFDVDDVAVLDRLGAGLENDSDAGVEHAMALYRWLLPKKPYKLTRDNFSETIGSTEWCDFKEGDDPTELYMRLSNLMASGRMTTLLGAIKWRFEHANLDGKADWLKYIASETQTYRFTNASDTIEYDDLLGQLKLEEEEFFDKDGIKQKIYSSNVYLWEDMRLRYYPCSGKSLNSGLYMTHNDRFFDKLDVGTPRSYDINKKINAGVNAPIGAWRYRYVWDFGDGIFSAPSAELVAPDMMWSAIRDSEIINFGTYRRPIEHTGLDYAKQYYVKYSNRDQDNEYWIRPYIDLTGTSLVDAPAIFKAADAGDDNQKLTNYGRLVFKIKEAMYKDINHKYGIKEWTSADDIDAEIFIESQDLTHEYLNHKGDFSTFFTVYFADDRLELNGFAFEGLFIYDHANWTEGEEASKAISTLGKLIVPIFQNELNPATRNSLFDDEGKIRLAWAGTINGEKFQLIMPGYNGWAGNPDAFGDFKDISDMVHNDKNAPEESNLYLNILCMSDSIFPGFTDYNNSPDLKNDNNIKLIYIRPHTVFRATRKENDRLLWTKEGLDEEAKSRLLLQGTASIDVVNEGEPLYYQSEYYDTEKIDANNLLGYNNLRRSYGLDDAANPQPYGSPTDPDHRYMDAGTYLDESQFASDYHVENMSVTVYGQGDRLLINEQLTAYFPSSLLFGAPRLGFKIDEEKVPARAKRLLVFRTKSSHNNDWDPNVFALCKEIKINREDNPSSSEYEKPYTQEEDGTRYPGVYFFDDIKDNELDFGHLPERYDGLTTALRSRFNIVLNERTYYYNFKEIYQPLSPRKNQSLLDTDLLADEIPDTAISIKDSTVDGEGFDTNCTVRYKYVYKDTTGIRSKAKLTRWYDVTPQVDTGGGNIVTTRKVVVLNFMPSGYNYGIDVVEIYRAVGPEGSYPPDAEYYYVGELKHEDEGIFVDDNISPGNKLGSLDPEIQNYEGGLRWSELHRPDWIKPDSFIEVKAGDGQQGTGIESLYGNLVTFKETSMHRYTVQSLNPENPISRVDEITPEVGAIAPLSVLNVDNTLYFLSRKGLMSYDNNQVKKIDLPFTEELQFLLANNKENYGVIRDSSMGYNPYYNEMYLNVPILSTDSEDGRQYDYGHAKFYRFQREQLGHIYVLCFDKQYATKFGYRGTLADPFETTDGYSIYIKEINHASQLMRMYYTTSLGELRSADLAPTIYGSLQGAVKNTDGYWWSGIWVETPYENTSGNGMFYDRDESMDGRWLSANFLHGNAYPNYTETVYGDWDFTLRAFPRAIEIPIRCAFKSKFFTAEAETIIKRIRKVLLNIFSKGIMNVRAITIPYEVYDERIDNQAYPVADQQFTYNPSLGELNPITLAVPPSTNRNIISLIPQTPEGWVVNRDKTYPIFTWDDFLGKPIRFSVELDSELRTQLNEIVIYLRPIHTYIG